MSKTERHSCHPGAYYHPVVTESNMHEIYNGPGDMQAMEQSKAGNGIRNANLGLGESHTFE